MYKHYLNNKIINFYEKIKGCENCHKTFNIIKEKKFIYKKLINFKNLKIFNINMNYIFVNIKNKYILNIDLYFSNLLSNLKFYFKNFNFVRIKNNKIWISKIKWNIL